MRAVPTAGTEPKVRRRRARKEKLVLGWREKIALPDLGITEIKAKIDTGARTSALHAFRIKPFRRGGKRFVRFYVHPVERHRAPELLCEAPVIDERTITSSNGKQEQRYVVETTLEIAGARWSIEVTLTNRDEMGFRMLLGRQALKRRAVVDPGSSYKVDCRRKSSTRDPRKAFQ